MATRSESPEFDDDEDFQDDDGPRRSSRSGGRRKKSSSTPAWVIVLIVMGGGFFLICPCLIALLLPAVQQAREAARRSQSRNNLKQIGLAAHNFLDSNQHFPPRNIEEETQPGEAMHSWTTDMLPYLDQGPLHESIQYAQPWNDPANRLPFATVIPSLINPSNPTAPIGVGGYAVTHYAANSQVMSDQNHLRLRDITDGTTSTILAGDVKDGVKPWGDPSNHRDPAQGLNSGPATFGSYHTGIVHFLMADGSVRAIRVDIDLETLKRLADPGDGQAVQEF